MHRMRMTVAKQVPFESFRRGFCHAANCCAVGFYDDDKEGSEDYIFNQCLAFFNFLLLFHQQ